MASSWKAVVQCKQDARTEAIAKVGKLLEVESVAASEDKHYIQAPAVEIVKNIEEGKWTSLAVVSAYIRQAIRAHKRTNCLTEILFEQALKTAADLDAEFASTNRLHGALHGIPMTVKDCFNVSGYDTSVGYTQWTGSPATRDARLVEHCRSLGAIFIAKTNVPQTMLSFECRNPVFGCTINPWSDAHTCGGSSGGEAAVLAQNGSALGLGSDIGGSLRIPAAFCGIYSLKPGFGRISRAGMRSTTPGYESVSFVTGPLARTCEDVELICRGLFGLPGTDDEMLPRLPYIEPQLPKKLRFGFYTSDMLIKASPACKRAVMETIQALRKHGHECIEFEPRLAAEAFSTFVALLSADGYKTLLSPLGPDPKDESLFLPTLGPRLPGFIRWLAVAIVKGIIGDDIFGNILNVSRTKSVEELMALQARRNELRQRWYEEVWKSYQFDGIICPAQASPAVTLGSTATLSPLSVATFLYNLIDSPVGIVPVTRVDPDLDKLSEEWMEEAGHGSLLLERDLYTKKDAVYNPEKMKGLPVSVQIVGRSYEDEKVVAMMKIVDKALGPRSFGPSAWSE